MNQGKGDPMARIRFETKAGSKEKNAAFTRSPSSRDIMMDVYNQTTGAFDTLQYWWLGGVRPAMNVSFE